MLILSAHKPYIVLSNRFRVTDKQELYWYDHEMLWAVARGFLLIVIV